jgi:dihydrofolate reductase
MVRDVLRANAAFAGRVIPTVSVFVGISVDGFLARSDGALDFLSVGDDEPHGYEEFIASVDAIVIGRATFETVLGFDEWPYGERRVIVLSHRPLPTAPWPARFEHWSGAPQDIVQRLVEAGVKHAYVDGGKTVAAFLRAGLVDRMTITRVPVLIGDGIPLFEALDRDVSLRHVETRTYPSGLVSTVYDVVR